MEAQISDQSTKSQHRPPFFVRYFLHVLVEVVKDGAERSIRFSMVVENFRTLFYWSLLGVILLGITLTKLFVEIDSTKIIKDVFGANNICAYFDFPPATYCLPFCWTFTMGFAVTYDVISMFRIWVACEEGKIFKRQKILLFLAHGYFIFSVMLLSVIFAVQPDRTHPETMIVHTIPYMNLKNAMFVLQLAVVWFGSNVAWKEFKLSLWISALNWFHVSLQGITMVISNILIINALGDTGEADASKECEGLCGKGLWWPVENTDVIVLIDIFANKLSFLCNFVFPLIQSQYISYRGYEDISKTHAVIISIEDNQEGKRNSKTC